MTPFTVTDRATWGELLTAEEVALILRRSVGGIRKAASTRTLVPAPFLTQPWRWRRADVVRYLDGPRAALRRTA